MGVDPNELTVTADRLTALMRDQLGVRADSFPRALAKAGRRLPRAIRAEGQVILSALDRAPNPRLARVTDGDAVRRAARRIEAYLGRLDPQASRARARAYLFADLAFRVAVAAALVIAVVAWRDLI